MRKKSYWFLAIFGVLVLMFSTEIKADNINVYNIKTVNKIVVKKGDKIKLKTNITGKVKWKSTNAKVAKVLKKGRVKALKCGKTKIIVKRNGIKQQCTILVKKKIKKASKKTIRMSVDYDNGIAGIKFENNSDQIIKVTASDFERFVGGKWEGVPLKEISTGMEPYENLEAGKSLLRERDLASRYRVEKGIYKITYTCMIETKKIYVDDIFEIQ